MILALESVSNFAENLSESHAGRESRFDQRFPKVMNMKILVVGDGHSAIHEVAVVEALRKLGHQVKPFYWQSYFNSQNPVGRLWQRVQNKFLIGPTLRKINTDLVDAAGQFNPKLIFIYRGTHIFPKTIAKIKEKLPQCVVYGYNNDDPFAAGHPPWLWRHFMKCLPIYDLVFSYRKHNIAEYINRDAKKVELLMPWYVPETDYPIAQGELIEKKYDVVFVGHYENDGRIEYLEKISQSKYTFGLFGPDWSRAPDYDWLQCKQPVLPVRGDFYRETLISAKIALCFLSTLNRDTYTRRCFEIPAMGVFMLCQYSDDLAQIFNDGVDVVFFRNSEEMLEKIDYYIKNDRLREQIAANGRERVVYDKHDISSRIKYVLSHVG
ncbi:MAG: glycosyltransferase [Pusillimonas sp.]|nr:glycosyltransferase [Pusillimonas sp.]